MAPFSISPCIEPLFSVRGAWHRGTASTDKEIEIAAAISLQDPLDVEPLIAAFHEKSWRAPAPAALEKLRFADVEVQATRRHVQLDRIAVAYQGERTADSRFRPRVQDDGAICCAAHACVGDSHHV